MRFREVIRAPFWLIAFIYFLFISLVVAVWAAIGNQPAFITWVVLTVLIVLIALKTTLVIEIDENELNEIQLKYSKPDGCIILCKINNEFIACVAIRKINAHTAELKRMYVHPAFREQGIGKNLLIKAIAFAKETNYSVIRLDTLNYMTPAINLYKKIGFYEIPAYYSNPIKTAVYFEITC